MSEERKKTAEAWSMVLLGKAKQLHYLLEAFNQEVHGVAHEHDGTNGRPDIHAELTEIAWKGEKYLTDLEELEKLLRASTSVNLTLQK